MKMLTMLCAALLTLSAAATLQAKPGFGELFYEGTVVRTVVPPAASPMRGRDNFYVVMPAPMDEAVAGQRGVAAVAPGDTDYHGGKWAVYFATWKVGYAPYLLTSETEVLIAAELGELIMTREMEADFKCPIQP